MTNSELLTLEKDNLNEIRLYREGLFWKAYERSAYILCSQQMPLKPTHRSYKSLKGETIISVGFPSSSEAKFLSGLEEISRDENHLVLKARQAISPKDFDEWKSSFPVGATPDCVTTKEAEADRSDIEKRIMSFNIAASTPLQCMTFLSELQSLILGR